LMATAVHDRDGCCHGHELQTVTLAGCLAAPPPRQPEATRERASHVSVSITPSAVGRSIVKCARFATFLIIWCRSVRTVYLDGLRVCHCTHVRLLVLCRGATPALHALSHRPAGTCSQGPGHTTDVIGCHRSLCSFSFREFASLFILSVLFCAIFHSLLVCAR
jgi:hypothetical protein